MSKAFLKPVLAGCAAALLLVLGLFQSTSLAWAAEPGIYAATATPSYANPVTGEIEDSAGESNVALGQSMVTGVVHPEALVEVDAQGSTFVTLRFSLANEIGEVLVSADQDGSGSSFGVEEAAQQMQVLGEGDIADYRFAVPSEASLVRANMYVEPMGRNVTYFVQVGGLVAGNPEGFVESVEPAPANAGSSAEPASSLAPEPTASSSAASSSAPSSASTSSSTAGSATAAASSTGASATSSRSSEANEDAAPSAGTSSEKDAQTGVKEYSGDGNEVTGSGAQSDSQAASSLNYPLVVGIIVALAAVVALVAYFAYVKPRRTRQDAAAAAAAVSKSDKE